MLVLKNITFTNINVDINLTTIIIINVLDVNINDVIFN